MHSPCLRVERTDVAHPRVGRTNKAVVALRRAAVRPWDGYQRHFYICETTEAIYAIANPKIAI